MSTLIYGALTVRVTAQVKERTEHAIRVAARNLFLTKGFEHTSTREIAQAAGIAVGTLFNYFPSKEALALSLALTAFESGRALSQSRLASPTASLEEDLFTLIAADLRELAPIRPFLPAILESTLSPFASADTAAPAVSLRAERLADAAAVLTRWGLASRATTPVMHLYWTLYLGVLAFWAADASPRQEDTLALVDQTVRMFAGALDRARSSAHA